MLGPGVARADFDPFDGLCKRLVKNGFDKAKIAEIYSQPLVKLDLSVAMGYFRHRESRVNYGQFTEKQAILNAKKYMARHEQALEAAQKAYDVDAEIITAILLVETRLGKFTGRKGILNTLSTLAALADNKNRDALWEKVSKKSSRKRPEMGAWALRKSKWAYKELKAYLKYTGRENMDPVKINGSFAGALGISQFMPTSILAYAADGNNDGKVDLFNHWDAIASVAKYLKAHGWKPGLDEKKMAGVVLTYNNSTYYVNAVLKIRSLLRKKI